jgi:predicted RNA-binding Zn ribbon-like protein
MSPPYPVDRLRETSHTLSLVTAPGDLAFVERFVNTIDFEKHTDDIGSPRELVRWAREHGAGGAFTRADTERVLAFREALRALLLAHHGEQADPAAVEVLRREGARVPLAVAFDDVGETSLTPAGTGADALLGRLLAAVAHADADGTWERMKACPADDCLWAFYDHSRNRSRTWCSMSGCGNRAKARAYRSRGG